MFLGELNSLHQFLGTNRVDCGGVADLPAHNISTPTNLLLRHGDAPGLHQVTHQIYHQRRSSA